MHDFRVKKLCNHALEYPSKNLYVVQLATIHNDVIMGLLLDK